MSCQQVDALLSSLLDNELTPEERRAVQDHLRGCESCWQTLAAYQAFNKAVLAALPTIEAAQPERSWPAAVTLPRVGAAVLASIALGGSALLGWLSLNNRPVPSGAGITGLAPTTIIVPGLPSQVAASQFITSGAIDTAIARAVAGVTAAQRPTAPAANTVTNPNTLDTLAGLVAGTVATSPGQTATARGGATGDPAEAIGKALTAQQSGLTPGEEAPSGTASATPGEGAATGAVAIGVGAQGTAPAAPAAAPTPTTPASTSPVAQATPGRAAVGQ